jgi:hypothetical protein
MKRRGAPGTHNLIQPRRGEEEATRPRSLCGTSGAAHFDRVEFCYNRQAEVIQMTDQNQTVHAYGYLCPCQLAVADFPRGRDVRTAKLARPRRSGPRNQSRNTGKRVGGAGGGASSPCSPARCGRKAGQDAGAAGFALSG